MTDKLIDLNIHTYKEVPGKILNLAGAEYIFQDILGEGAAKVVYPIKNIRSGLILYVAKIYKLRPGSPQLKHIISELPRALFNLVIPNLILYTEFHEIPGATMELQPYGVQDNPEFCKEQMAVAIELLERRQWSKAVSAFDRVLDANPNHSIAMLNQAISFLNLGGVQDAIRLTENSITIEPNFPEAYRLLSSIILQLGRPEESIAPLRKTLDRFNCDPRTWEELLNIAIDYDLVDIASNALQEVNRLGAGVFGEAPKPFVHFAKSLEESTARWNDYNHLLSKALTAQMENSWNEALVFCIEAMNKSKNNGLATLNFFVCNYHLGKGSAIAEELFSNLYRWDSIELAAAASLALLCFHLANRPEKVKQIALWIATRYHHHVDIPAVPVAISNKPTLFEARSGKPVVDALTSIENLCSKEEAKQIAYLKKLYMKREKDFSQG